MTDTSALPGKSSLSGLFDRQFGETGGRLLAALFAVKFAVAN
jgi:hypothetical protein